MNIDPYDETTIPSKQPASHRHPTGIPLGGDLVGCHYLTSIPFLLTLRIIQITSFFSNLLFNGHLVPLYAAKFQIAEAEHEYKFTANPPMVDTVATHLILQFV